MNQPEFLAITCNLLKVQGVIGFGLASNRLKNRCPNTVQFIGNN